MINDIRQKVFPFANRFWAKRETVRKRAWSFSVQRVVNRRESGAVLVTQCQKRGHHWKDDPQGIQHSDCLPLRLLRYAGEAIPTISLIFLKKWTSTSGRAQKTALKFLRVFFIASPPIYARYFYIRRNICWFFAGRVTCTITFAQP